MLSRTGGETFCIYKTPCGFCSRLNKYCTEDCSPKNTSNTNSELNKRNSWEEGFLGKFNKRY